MNSEIICSCGHVIAVTPDMLGKAVKCPTCSRIVSTSHSQAPVALQYVAAGAAGMGGISAPESDYVPVPEEISAKHVNPQGVPCHIMILPGAPHVNADFPLRPVMQKFINSLASKAKSKYNISLTSTPGPGLNVTLQILTIEMGNRFLRYLFGIFGGHARFEVQGSASMNGGPETPLHAKLSLSFGLLGGNSQSLLTSCAAGCGKKIAKQLLKLR